MKIVCLSRAIRNRCPRCGKGPVLRTLFIRHDECSECGFDYVREEGFFIGGIPISYGLISGLWIVPLLTVWMIGWVPLEWLLGLCFGGALVFPILSYRYCQCLWLGLYFVFVWREIKEWFEDSPVDIPETDSPD